MKEIIVIGCGRFGTSVAKTLNDLGHDVMIVDNDAETVEELSEFVTHAIQIDATDESAYNALGLKNFDVAVIAIGSNLEASIMATLMAKEKGVPFVIAKAKNETHAMLLKKIGADNIVFPERDMGIRIANNLTTPNILEAIRLSSEYSIIETVALEEWVDNTIEDLKFSKVHKVNIIAIRSGEEIYISPPPDSVIKKGDILVVLGDNKSLKKFNGKE
ncbi:potassium channel family protein [Sedimentibacter sp. MB31-C6]|uniref:potassium channel family protein n=1 Tax=Sedimentibacter sp. MB31-C6 TaxID=3109366 RepID=UPI002DDD0EFE|nr:TrkA family potassium uptake protein [Sedimentibacter sp. MB36-C1]WSI05624.1 TrkA family potassium uptake protein [Sedimentibacter sp. MB36-C1]